MEEMICRKGEVVFREGDTGTNMYKILSGGAAVYSDYGGKEEKLLAELHAGEYFGEMAVIEIRERSATVVASEDDTRLRVVDVYDLSEYLEEHPDEISSVAKHLSNRVRIMTGIYIEVCDTLRELGRLDTSADKIGQGLMERIAKFARIHLKNQKLDRGEDSEWRSSPQAGHNEGYSLPLQSYYKGDVIFRERDRSDCMYDIHSGCVGIYKDYGTEKQKLLTKLTSDMFFGEMGLFEKLHRSATAVALENGTKIEPIRDCELSELFAKNPAKVLMLLEHLSGRLRQLTIDYLKACRALAETEEQIKRTSAVMTPETMAQIEYMNQLLLMPEVIY
ncbi:MAG: cyclic nucleotide-binding domain-containing protein [Oscillospiraceae bacterium]|nr:cyclic nucleotide-binding domain-containing protein [Oscillospiraceae bacterium]